MAKGKFIEYVVSNDPNKYPNENAQDGYYYRKVVNIETEEQTVTAGTTLIEVIPSEGKLISKVNNPGVRTGVIIWFKDHDKVIYVPIKTVTKMKKEGKKSINIKTDLDNYRIFKIPGKKKRVFIECDYSILTTLEDGD